MLVAELTRLVERERPRVVQEVADAAAQGDRSENAEYTYGKKRLREIDRRARYITQRLDRATAVDVDKDRPGIDRIYFGAIVSLLSEHGDEQTVQIVGPDEVDPQSGLVSYQAPLGKALMKRTLGECFVFVRPKGDLELEITSVRYGAWLPDELSADSD